VNPISITFSILERIDDVVTRERLSAAGTTVTFSILERIDDVVTDPRAFIEVAPVVTFSILERIDDVVTLTSILRSSFTLTFSILERIDDVVTAAPTWTMCPGPSFQYPRTDRRCCDGEGASAPSPF